MHPVSEITETAGYMLAAKLSVIFRTIWLFTDDYAIDNLTCCLEYNWSYSITDIRLTEQL